MTFDNRAAPRHAQGPDSKLSEAARTYSYERKSNKSKDGTNKSIEDQRAVNLETAEEFGLHLPPENQLSEEPGLGGDLFWRGFQGTGLEGDDRTGVRFRPILTDLVEAMKAGKVKNLLVYSQCRLWRSVSLAHMMLDLMGECGVKLYDRNGPIPINTPEGRQSVLNGAVAAQIYRENCAAYSSRGTRSTRKKLKVVVNGNVVGFRHVAKHKIEVVPGLGCSRRRRDRRDRVGDEHRRQTGSPEDFAPSRTGRGQPSRHPGHEPTEPRLPRSASHSHHAGRGWRHGHHGGLRQQSEVWHRRINGKRCGVTVVRGMAWEFGKASGEFSPDALLIAVRYGWDLGSRRLLAEIHLVVKSSFGICHPS